MAAFFQKAKAIERAPRREVTAKREGFLSIDVPALRTIFVSMNVSGDHARPFPDELGVILRRRPGAYVSAGDVVASVRAPDALWPTIAEALATSFQVRDLLDYAPGMEGVIRA